MTTRTGGSGLVLVLLATLLAALGRTSAAGTGPAVELPYKIHLPVALPQKCLYDPTPMALAFVVDGSNSMLSPMPGSTSRLAAATDALRGFAAGLRQHNGYVIDQVALVGFNDRAWVEQGLTADQGAFGRALDRLAGQLRPGSRQDLGLAAAGALLSGPDRHRGAAPVAVLITDGGPTGVDGATVLATSARLKDAGIFVAVIGLSVENNLEAELLAAVASDEDLYLAASEAAQLPGFLASFLPIIEGCGLGWP